MKRVILSCAIFMSFLLSGETAIASTDDVKIGFIASLTGGGALWGNQDRIGGLMAVEDINESGGILIDGKNRNVKLVIEDDETKPAVAVKALRKLANDGIHVCVTGGTLITMALSGLNEDLGIILYTYSTTPSLTQSGNKLLLRAYPTQEWLAGALGYVAGKELGINKIGLLNTNDDYGNSYKSYFSDLYTAHGGEVVADLVFKTGDPDFYSQLTSIRETSPDAIQLSGFTGDAPVLVRQAREILGDITLFGADYYKTDTFEQLGERADGFVFTQTSIHVVETAEKESFLARYAERGGLDPIWGALSYERVRNFAKAMEIANTTTDVVKIREALEVSAKEAVTLGGVTEWLPNGDVKKATVGVYRWDAKQGTAELIKSFNSLEDIK